MPLIWRRVGFGPGIVQGGQQLGVIFMAFVGLRHAPLFGGKREPRLEGEPPEFIRGQTVQFSFNFRVTYHRRNVGVIARVGNVSGVRDET